jgi:hypothetical protein
VPIIGTGLNCALNIFWSILTKLNRFGCINFIQLIGGFVFKKPPATVRAIVEGKYKHEIDLPAKRIVCDRCKGTGRHVNPNIDGNGLSANDIDELGGAEFMSEYMRGAYDVTCYECKGERVLDVVDVDALSEKMRKRYFKALDTKARDDADDYYERLWRA